jgi:ferrous iron transport protein B
MPTFALFIGFFFPDKWYIAPLIYFLGILAVIFTGLLSQKLDKHKEKNTFILELPRYQVPTIKNVWLQTKERIMGFIHKAGTIILLASALIYVLQSFSFTFSPVEPQFSILAQIGRVIAPIFKPLGFGTWQATVALLTGIAAKESIVSTLTVTMGTASIGTLFDGASAIAFMAFVLLSFPCVAAQSAMFKELDGNKIKFLKAICYQFVLAYAVALVLHVIFLEVL